MYKGVNVPNLESNERQTKEVDEMEGWRQRTRKSGLQWSENMLGTSEEEVDREDTEDAAKEAEARRIREEDGDLVSSHSHGTRSSTSTEIIGIKDTTTTVKPQCICKGCGKSYKQRLDGMPFAHICVGGKKNVSDTTDANGRPSKIKIARDRARDNKNAQRTMKGQAEKIYGSDNDNSDDQELLGDLGRHDERAIDNREQVEMSRQRRRRRQTLAEFDSELREKVRLAAEGDMITKAEFSEKVGAILDCTPPDFLPVMSVSSGILTKRQLMTEGERMSRDHDDDFFDVNDPRGEYMSNGQKLTKEGRMLKDIHKHMRNGDMSKARRAMNGNGIFDISTPEGSGLLKSKYPVDETRRNQGEQYRESAENEIQKRQSVANGLDRVAAREHLLGYIKTRKRGAARAWTGHCNDHFSNMIKKDPTAADDIVIICDRIAGGSMIDGEASAKLVRGKGTPLSKKEGEDVRPTSTLHPLLSYTGMLIVKMAEERIREVCGSEQLGMDRSGVEKQGHAIRAILERDHENVTGVCDVWNAYNAPDQKIIAVTVREHVGELAELTDLLMAQKPVEVVFADRKSGQVHVTQMLTGMQQGGTNSTATFCVVLAVQVTSVLKVEFTDLDILCISDNITFSGRPMRVVECFERCVLLLKDGMGCVASMPKSTIFGFGGNYPDDARQRARELGINWIDADQGFVSAGVPIGSQKFMEETVEKTADKIIAELDAIQALVQSPLSNHYNTVQTMASMIRLCSTQQLIFMLRVVPPEATYRSARRVDIAVANTIAYITDCLKFMAPEHTDGLNDQLQAMFSPVRLGGMGLINAVNCREGAYVASVMGCGKFLADILPEIKDMAASQQLTESLEACATLIVQMQENGSKALENINPYGNMWDENMLGMQRKINSEKLQAAADQMMAKIPAGGRNPRTGVVDNEGTVQRIRMLNNQNGIASAWITANAGFRENYMTNTEYSIAFALRMGLPVAGSRTSCVCGASMDTHCEHALICPATRVRARLRNTLHTILARKSKEIAVAGSKGGGYTVETASPAVGRFLEAKEGQDTTKLFSDIATHKTGGAGHVTLADVTTTHPAADCVIEALRKSGDPYKPGCAAEHGVTRKAAHYNAHFDLEHRLVAEPVDLITISFETSGAIDRETEQWIRGRATDIARGTSGMGPHETPQSGDIALALRQIYQKYSVSLQAWKARAVVHTVKHFSLDSRPTYPYVPGSNCRLLQPEPPAFIGLPINRGRRYVETPLPTRGQHRHTRLHRQ